jgi:hypothetical protein
MPTISTERLSGLIAGVCLIWATESFLSTLNVVFLSATDMSAKMIAVVPGLVVAAAAGFLAYAYLFFTERKLWLHIVALVVFTLAAFGSISSAVVSIFMDSPASLDSMRTSMVIGGVIRLFISLALLACVVVMMKRSPLSQRDQPEAG